MDILRVVWDFIPFIPFIVALPFLWMSSSSLLFEFWNPTLRASTLDARVRIIRGYGYLYASFFLTLVGCSAFVNNEIVKILVNLQLLFILLYVIFFCWKGLKERKLNTRIKE
jgi:hypothetical protein